MERGLIALLAGTSLAAAEAVAARLAKVRDELGEAPALPLENLLTQRVVLCWLACHAAAVGRGELPRRGTGELLEAADKRVDRAHARLLTATKALAAGRAQAGRAGRFGGDLTGGQPASRAGAFAATSTTTGSRRVGSWRTRTRAAESTDEDAHEESRSGGKEGARPVRRGADPRDAAGSARDGRGHQGGCVTVGRAADRRTTGHPTR